MGPFSVSAIGFGAMRLTGPGVFGPPKDHDEALAVLNTAVGRLLGRPEVAPQPGALTAGTLTGKLVGPGWHEEPGAAVATDVHVRVAVRGRSRSRTVAVARSK